jgi:hypothetical protein
MKFFKRSWGKKQCSDPKSKTSTTALPTRSSATWKKESSLGLGRGTPNMRQHGLPAHFATMGSPTADFLAGTFSLRELIDRLEQVGVVVKVERTQSAGRNDEHNS